MRARDRSNHVPALDGVRGIAVAAVLLFHGGHLVGGYLGVDLFFVLSGFLITSLLLDEGERADRIALGRFWERRARRLFPALALLLVGVALYAAWLAAPADRGRIRADAFATLLYVPNWLAVLGQRDYWALFRTPSPLQHTWSLGIEEQFYLVWPLALAAVFALARRRAAWIVGAGSLVLAAASVAAMAWLYDPADPSRVYYGTDTRAAAILLGAALAAWRAVAQPTRSRAARALVELAGAVGLAVLAVAWLKLDGDAPALYRGGLALCGLAGTALIAAAAHPQRGPLAWLLSLAPLRGLGIVSYGVYLWHWPVYLVLDPARTGLAGAPLLAVRVAATLAVALASYVFVERPIRRGWGRPRDFAVIAPITVGALVIAIAAGTAGSRSAEAPASPVSPRGGAAGAVRVLLLGDSMAVSLSRGLALAGPEHGLEIAVGVKVDCARGSAEPGCPPPWGQQVAQQHPDLVVVAETGYWSLYARRIDGAVADIGTEAWDRIWLREWQANLDELRAAGAHRIVVTTLPCFPPESSRRFPRLAPAHTAHANAHLTALAARNAPLVRVVDLEQYMCPGGTGARRPVEAQAMWDDAIHLSHEGSERVGRWLAPELARAARD